MDKKEREVIQKLANKIGDVDPAQVEYKVEGIHYAISGRYHILKFRLGGFKVELKGVSASPTNNDQDQYGPYSYELIVLNEEARPRHKRKILDYKFDAARATWDKEAYNELEEFEKSIVDNYEKIHRAVEEYQTQKAKQEKSSGLNKLEQALN